MGKAMKVSEKARKVGILTDEKVVKAVRNELTLGDLDEELEGVEVIPAKPKTNLMKSRGELDEFGFGSETHSSFLLKYLEQGTNTKAEIVEAFCDHFRMDVDGKATTDKTLGQRDDARKKSSMSVFFSDVVKPFGTYHASRSLLIMEDKQTGRLSLEPKRMTTVKKAIASGIVAKLKGFNSKKHPEKVAAILKNFNLPKE